MLPGMRQRQADVVNTGMRPVFRQWYYGFRDGELTQDFQALPALFPSWGAILVSHADDKPIFVSIALDNSSYEQVKKAGFSEDAYVRMILDLGLKDIAGMCKGRKAFLTYKKGMVIFVL